MGQPFADLLPTVTLSGRSLQRDRPSVYPAACQEPLAVVVIKPTRGMYTSACREPQAAKAAARFIRSVKAAQKRAQSVVEVGYEGPDAADALQHEFGAGSTLETPFMRQSSEPAPAGSCARHCGQQWTARP